MRRTHDTREIIMKKRLFLLYLPLSVVLVGCLLVGYTYQRACRQVKLDRSLVTAVENRDVRAVRSCLNEGVDAQLLEVLKRHGAKK